ncbi:MULTISPECIES: hypothetical protein [Sphingopyxis]|uniref:Uncharacterized protein n=1 Tax=Sphingopyxis granuli TaxID=267128 RepID=A0AA86GJR2_9SPHN|nr:MULTISPECIES: hypothetical protein [Sphingopyxis]AMG73486.1 Uncharacterized protein SGRAN_1093 [Sphingopyxis granuli]APW72021.1 hypothetical protein BWD40_03290 [Sphingopyxis granuli]AVA12769.1 hypothetical protein C3E99_01920 [Sphingopyxis sp. MG]
MTGKRMGQMMLIAAGFAAGAATPAAMVMADAGPAKSSFDEISVKRINIVEPDGKYRLVLANSERFPGLFMEGKEYKHHSRDTGGMLFFNDEGDEVGGLTFDSKTVGENRRASASLMFDQYKQDQTVGIQYSEANGQRAAGLRVWDRPDWPIKPLMEMSERAATAPDQAARDRIREEMRAYATAKGTAAERLFVGKTSDDAIVKLADKSGKPRLLLRVGASGEPSIEFLDATGKVVKRIS